MLPHYLEFLNSPVNQEFFIQFLAIFSRNKNGDAVAINFHHDNRDNIVYCNKILVGETIESAVRRSLLDDFGLKLTDYSFYTFLMDSTNNIHGQSTARFPFVVYVEYGPLKNEVVTGCHVTWIDREKYHWGQYPDEALWWLKGHQSLQCIGKNQNVARDDVMLFVKKMYHAGAIDVVMGNSISEQEPEDFDNKNPDYIEIRLPKDAKSRENLFKIIHAGFPNMTPQKNPEADTDQENIRCYF